MLLLCRRSGWTRVLMRDWLLLERTTTYRCIATATTAYTNSTAVVVIAVAAVANSRHTLFAKNLLSGVGYLSKNRLWLRKYSLSMHCVGVRFEGRAKCMLIVWPNYLAARCKGLIALGARETFLMVCVAHRRHDLAFNILLAYRTFGAVGFLVIDDAKVVVIFRKEAAGC